MHWVGSPGKPPGAPRCSPFLTLPYGDSRVSQDTCALLEGDAHPRWDSRPADERRGGFPAIGWELMPPTQRLRDLRFSWHLRTPRVS